MLLTVTIRSILMLLGVKTLLQGLLNSNSHGNGHADHGVVTSAQEAHHLNVKSACRRLSACGATAFGTGSPAFRKTRSTSHKSSMLCFPSWAYLITSSVQETICLTFFIQAICFIEQSVHSTKSLFTVMRWVSPSKIETSYSTKVAGFKTISESFRR